MEVYKIFIHTKSLDGYNFHYWPRIAKFRLGIPRGSLTSNWINKMEVYFLHKSDDKSHPDNLMATVSTKYSDNTL